MQELATLRCSPMFTALELSSWSLLPGEGSSTTHDPLENKTSFLGDPRRFCEMADPLLDSKFPERGLNQAVAIAAMCLQDEATARPMMSDVVTALSFLSVASESDPTPTDTRKGGDKSRSSSHSESSQSSGFRSGSKSDKFYEDEDIINSSEATTSDAAWSGGPRSARISRQRDGSASLDYRTGGSANWVLEFTSSDEDPEPDRR